MREDRKPGYWAVVPADVRYDPELPPNAKLLYAEISALCDREGYCFATNKYFADLYGLSSATVQRLIKALVDRGHISVEVLRDPETREVLERRIYAGVQPLENVPEPDAPTSPQKCGEGSPQKCGDPSPQKCGVEQSSMFNNTPLNPPKGGERAKSVPKWKPERFEGFWKYYSQRCHKADRAGAVRAWDRLKPSDELIAEIGRSLERMLTQDDEWSRGIGIPHASRYLRDRRWEDTPTTRAGAESPPDSGKVERRRLQEWT